MFLTPDSALNALTQRLSMPDKDREELDRATAVFLGDNDDKAKEQADKTIYRLIYPYQTAVSEAARKGFYEGNRNA